MKGKLIKKENNWYIRTITSEESDDVSIVDYFVESSAFKFLAPKEGLEINFKLNDKNQVIL